MNKSLKRIVRAGFVVLFFYGLVGTAFAQKVSNQQKTGQGVFQQAVLDQFCEFMKRQNPQIKNWKKGTLPTRKELTTLLKAHPELEKDMNRVVKEFFAEVKSNPEVLMKYQEKIKKDPSVKSDSQQGRSSKK